MILLNMPPAEAFLSLINLVNKSFLKGFYSADHADVRSPWIPCLFVVLIVRVQMDAYYRIFDTLLADTMPDVYASKHYRTTTRLIPCSLTSFLEQTSRKKLSKPRYTSLTGSQLCSSATSHSTSPSGYSTISFSKEIPSCFASLS